MIRLNENNEFYIVATELISTLREKLSGYDIDEMSTIDVSALENCSYLHPIDGRCEMPFLKGNHVTSTAGTGLVHTAPAHGFDDYLVALQAKMPVVSILLEILQQIYFRNCSRNGKGLKLIFFFLFSH